MSDFKLWGWDKKPRTMLRFIKAGDIFCFKLDEQRYCFGRIIIKIFIGHVAELFDNISNSPDISEAEIKQARRLIEPVILDSYSLFDRK
ncbi:Imm26 family immunity protein, partial [Snodgrassella alvi]